MSIGAVNGEQVLWNNPTEIQLTSIDAIVSLSSNLVVAVGSPYVVAIQIADDGNSFR